MAALVTCALLGPRSGRFVEGQAVDLPQQSVIFQTLGTLILWFGWYGFNGVSTLYIANYAGVAAHTMVTTTIAAGTCCLATATLGKIVEGHVTPSNANNGVLAGLVSITAGCSTVAPEGAFLIGLIGAPIFYFSNKMLLKLKVDDVVSAVPVHGFCGIWGVIAAGLFATEEYYSAAYYSARAADCAGLFYGGGAMLGANIMLVLFVIVWTGVCTLVIVLPLKMFGMLRVSADVEEIGMDDSKHGGAVDTLSRTVFFKSMKKDLGGGVVAAARISF